MRTLCVAASFLAAVLACGCASHVHTYHITNPASATMAAKKTGGQGLVYRIPTLADVRVLRGTKELTSGQFQVAQLGTTAFLPNTTGGRKTQYTAELYAATGGLKNILIGQEALLNATMASSVGGAITSLQDAKAAADKANAPRPPKTQRDLDEEAIRAARAKACLADPLNPQCANIK